MKVETDSEVSIKSMRGKYLEDLKECLPQLELSNTGCPATLWKPWPWGDRQPDLN